MIYKGTWKEEFSYKSFLFRFKGHYNAFIRPMVNKLNLNKYFF